MDVLALLFQPQQLLNMAVKLKKCFEVPCWCLRDENTVSECLLLHKVVLMDMRATDTRPPACEPATGAPAVEIAIVATSSDISELKRHEQGRDPAFRILRKFCGFGSEGWAGGVPPMNPISQQPSVGIAANVCQIPIYEGMRGFARSQAPMRETRNAGAHAACRGVTWSHSVRPAS